MLLDVLTPSLCALSHIAANILRITYGIDVNDVHDPWITLIGRAMDVGRRTGAPGSFLVDIITPCVLLSNSASLKADRLSQ